MDIITPNSSRDTHPTTPFTDRARLMPANATIRLDTGVPARKKRRPALACEQCDNVAVERSSKWTLGRDVVSALLLTASQHRCDRQTPCRPCSRANTGACVYVCDVRQVLTTPPFEAQETQFSVFEQKPQRFTVTATNTGSSGYHVVPTVTALAPINMASIPFEVFEGLNSTPDSASLSSFPEQDLVSATAFLSSPSPQQPLTLSLDLASLSNH
jgi:hypothetical protein